MINPQINYKAENQKEQKMNWDTRSTGIFIFQDEQVNIVNSNIPAVPGPIPAISW